MNAKTRSPEKPAAPQPKKDDRASQRRAAGRTYVAFASTLVVLIALMVNYLAFRHYQRWDWTEERVFTLSDRTRRVVADLDRDVEIYFVLSALHASHRDVRELLERYRAINQRITLHFIDPDREPTEYRSIAERFGLGLQEFEDGRLESDVAMVIASGERQWKVTSDDLVTRSAEPSGEDGQSTVDVRSEQAITGGILEAISGRRTKVCVTEGHGEWTLNRGAERDLGGLADEMRRENLEIQTFATRGAQRVPEDCDLVVVVAPTTAFSAPESDLLRDYVRGGGNLLVAAEPSLDRDGIALTGLESMLRDFGIRVDRSLVLELDPASLPANAVDPTGPFLVQQWGEHRITEPYRQSPSGLVAESARSVRPVDPDRATVLLSTSESSFAETDVAGLIRRGEPTRDDADIAGPVSIGVATRVERLGESPSESEDDAQRREGGRVVVLGDADMFAARYLALGEVVNYPFASGVIGWLSAREALIELPPRQVARRAMRLTEADAWGLGFRVVVLLPAALFFLGFATWWNRRS